jgi:hypothetical protein
MIENMPRTATHNQTHKCACACAPIKSQEVARDAQTSGAFCAFLFDRPESPIPKPVLDGARFERANAGDARHFARELSTKICDAFRHIASGCPALNLGFKPALSRLSSCTHGYKRARQECHDILAGDFDA